MEIFALPSGCAFNLSLHNRHFSFDFVFIEFLSNVHRIVNSYEYARARMCVCVCVWPLKMLYNFMHPHQRTTNETFVCVWQNRKTILRNSVRCARCSTFVMISLTVTPIIIKPFAFATNRCSFRSEKLKRSGDWIFDFVYVLAYSVRARVLIQFCSHFNTVLTSIKTIKSQFATCKFVQQTQINTPDN